MNSDRKNLENENDKEKEKGGEEHHDSATTNDSMLRSGVLKSDLIKIVNSNDRKKGFFSHWYSDEQRRQALDNFLKTEKIKDLPEDTYISYELFEDYLKKYYPSSFIQKYFQTGLTTSRPILDWYNQSLPFYQPPLEVHLHLFSFLRKEDIVAMKLTASHFNELLNSDNDKLLRKVTYAHTVRDYSSPPISKVFTAPSLCFSQAVLSHQKIAFLGVCSESPHKNKVYIMDTLSGSFETVTLPHPADHIQATKTPNQLLIFESGSHRSHLWNMTTRTCIKTDENVVPLPFKPSQEKVAKQPLMSGEYFTVPGHDLDRKVIHIYDGKTDQIKATINCPPDAPYGFSEVGSLQNGNLFYRYQFNPGTFTGWLNRRPVYETKIGFFEFPLLTQQLKQEDDARETFSP